MERISTIEVALDATLSVLNKQTSQIGKPLSRKLLIESWAKGESQEAWNILTWWEEVSPFRINKIGLGSKKGMLLKMVLRCILHHTILPIREW